MMGNDGNIGRIAHRRDDPEMRRAATSDPAAKSWPLCLFTTALDASQIAI